MAKKRPGVKLEDGEHCFSMAYAARLLGKTQQTLRQMAYSGAIRFQPDKLGTPFWFPEAEITLLRREADRVGKRADPKPRPAPPVISGAACRPGWITDHYEKIMLADIHDPLPKPRPEQN